MIRWTLEGLVRNELGAAIAGAKIHAQEFASYPLMTHDWTKHPEPLTAGPDGQFHVEVNERKNLVIIGDGYAPLGFVPTGASRHEFVLDRGREIHGRILTPSGEPAENAVVRPISWAVPVEGVQPGRELFGHPAQSHWGVRFPEFGKALAVRTDENGEFRLKHMPNQALTVSVQLDDTLESLVHIQGDDDPVPDAPDGPERLENGFEFQLLPCAFIMLKATGPDGRPERILRLGMQPAPVHFRTDGLRRYEEFASDQVRARLLPSDAATLVWVEPADGERLLGMRLELPPIAAGETIEREVRFPAGIRIEGRVVDDATGDPLNRVRMEWRSTDELRQHAADGSFPRLWSFTDEDGKFALAVPDADGLLGVVGPVKDHSALSGWDFPPALANLSETAREFYLRRLERGKIRDDTEFEFRLPADYTLDVAVNFPDGSPAAGAIVAGQGPGRRGSGTLEADAGGRVSIPGWYGEVSSLESAIDEARLAKEPSGGDGPVLLFGPAPDRQLRVVAFAPDGFMQGWAEVPLPDLNSPSKSIPITIVLQPGGDVVGRIVDEAGDGIAGLKLGCTVRVNGFGGPGQEWMTETRDDGWFRMRGLPPRARSSWGVDRTRVKTALFEGKIEIDTTPLESGQVLAVQPVVCADFLCLLGELPELSIDGLDDEAALRALLNYIAGQFSRIPPRMTPQDQTENSLWKVRSSADPVPAFKSRVVAKVQPLLEQLIDRQPGTDFELRALVAVNDAARDRGNSWDQPRLRQLVVRRLMANQLDNPSARELIARVVMTDDTPFSSIENLRLLVEKSPFDDTRAIACARLVWQFWNDARQSSREIDPREPFELNLRELEQFAELAATIPPPEAASKDFERIKSQYLMVFSSARSRQLLDRSADGPSETRIDKSRIEKLNRLLESLEPPLREVYRW